MVRISKSDICTTSSAADWRRVAAFRWASAWVSRSKELMNRWPICIATNSLRAQRSRLSRPSAQGRASTFSTSISWRDIVFHHEPDVVVVPRSHVYHVQTTVVSVVIATGTTDG
jgi:hypothetical protein